MSVIVTGIDMPKSCGECNASGTGVCRKWFDVKELGSKRSEHCLLKSVDGLIKRINKLAYSEAEYGIEEFDASKIVHLDDLVEVIKEYCGMEDK